MVGSYLRYVFMINGGLLSVTRGAVDSEFVITPEFRAADLDSNLRLNENEFKAYQKGKGQYLSETS